MQRKYTYYPKMTEEEDLVWRVFEEDTKQVIASFLFEEDCIDLMEWLENGGGFAGWTPAFMLVQAAVHEDVNTAFTAIFGQDTGSGATS